MNTSVVELIMCFKCCETCSVKCVSLGGESGQLMATVPLCWYISFCLACVIAVREWSQ